MFFRLNPVFITMITAHVFSSFSYADVLQTFNPRDNDNLAGMLEVNNAGTTELTGNQQFEAGTDGSITTTIGNLLNTGRIINDNGVIGANRLDPGPLNFGISIPDPVTGGHITFQVYNPENIVALTTIDANTRVQDVENVGSGMYLNTRVADVTNGTLNVNIGQSDASSTADTNSWQMVAKQSALFNVDGSSNNATLNWNSNNRISFSGAEVTTEPLQLQVNNIVSYTGAFSVTTRDGKSNNFNVTNAGELKTYNNWLIKQLQAGNLASSKYLNEFNKALSRQSKQIIYSSNISEDDEAAQPIGERVVIKTSGPNGHVNIAAGSTLEVTWADGGAIQANDGATVVIDGKVSNHGSSSYDSSALNLIKGSTGTNNGVINGGFLNQADGTGIGPISWGGNAVNVTDNSKFENTGVVNFTISGSSGSAINLVGSNAINSGNINVGVSNSFNSGSMTGVSVDTNSRFTNFGTIYIGRGPQNSLDDHVAETAINQSSTTSGILIRGNGYAANNGKIIIGSQVQNAAGIRAINGANTIVVNNGTIDINGHAGKVTTENIGISVINAGSGGNINNAGTINLNGVNARGIKVLANPGTRAAANSTGTINVNGSSDLDSDTRNFAIWVEGEGSGIASTTVNGTINLSGIGAIGVHARGNSNVDIGDTAIMNFSNGNHQIGFFAYGPKAKINNLAGDTAFDITTNFSTLFRLEQGSSFNGNNLSLAVSGNNSIGLLGTGDEGTEVNLQKANITVAGNGATGMIVAGGTQGTISEATTINLTGVNTVGAIADGLKYNLVGDRFGDALDSTSLLSKAVISSAQNNLTGLIARNSALLTNAGNVILTGADSIGMLVTSGAKGTNDGNISVNNGGTGIFVNSDPHLETVATNSGTITVEGGDITRRTRGISVTGNNALANLSGMLNMKGLGAIGADVFNGATINIAADATTSFNNSDQIAYYATGSGSIINSAASNNDVSTINSTLYRIDNAAVLNFNAPMDITLSSADSHGVIVSGSNSLFNDSNSQFTVNGQRANALQVTDEARGVLASGTTIALNGADSIGVRVDNLRTDLNKMLRNTAPASVTSSANVNGTGENSIAYSVADGAVLIHQGTVNMDGINNIGIRVYNSSNIINNGVVNVAQGTGLDISGNGTSLAQVGEVNVADGIAGVRISNGAQLAISGNDARITTNGSAHGILLDSGAAGLYASDATLNVNGSGHGIENSAETHNVMFKNMTVNVMNGSGLRTATPFDPTSTITTNVSGNGIGLNFTQADDTPLANDLSLGNGYRFNVTGAGGTGIRFNSSGMMQSAANITISDINGGSALVAPLARLVVNTGVLTTASTSAPVVDLRGSPGRFENHGTIIHQSPDGVAITGSDDNDVILLAKGHMVGDINTGKGTDGLAWRGGTLNGSLTLGEGINNRVLIDSVILDKTLHITNGGGTGGILAFNQIDAQGGGFDTDDLSKGVNLGSGWSHINFHNTRWTLTNNLKLAHSTINIDAKSTLYAGNEVHPTLAGGSNNSLVVNNAGTIDLTNGNGLPGDTLTIDGDLDSDNGQLKLITDLNDGGALSNQFTDSVLVEGNSNGTTLLDVTPSALSNGHLTDLNQNGIFEADEGISLAQVAGNASANSFALKGGYLAVGPWSYVLYSFAPGESDASQRRVADGSDNQFWDYRLGNEYRCEDNDECQPGSEVPEVVPQVPAYISTPMALVYYTTAIIDDLHKRLGELRQQQAQQEDHGSELFLRYIGSNLTYNTSQDFEHYGYNFDLNYSAMQIGGNLLRRDGEKDSLRGGVAYTRGHTSMRPDNNDGYSSTTFNSDSLALYMTWQRDNGFYLDGTLSYNWHRGETDIARQHDVAKLKGQGWAASVEGGYPFEFDNGVRLEPQAQLMYMRLGMDNLTDKDQLTVKYNSTKQTIGRVGARVDRTWGEEKQWQYTPYLNTNYYRGWGDQSKITVGAKNYDVSNTFTGGRFGQMWEVGLGGTTTFNNAVSFYAEADYRKEIDGNGSKGWRYNVGVRWAF